MTKDSSNNFTLITGASSGIGKALANECANRGMNLYLISLPDDGLDHFVNMLEKKYTIQVHYMTLDLTRSDAPKIVFDYAKNMKLYVDVLFNNAGIGHVGNFHEMKSEEVKVMIDLNLRALSNMTLLFLKEMIGKNQGHIVNVSSLGAYMPVAFKSVYLASKSYVYHFTAALQQEYKNSGIKFSVLMPGPVVTSSSVKERVEKAGFFSRISVLTPEAVAKYTLDKMDHGKFAIMPGQITRSIFQVSKFLPSGVLLAITQKVFNQNGK